MRSSKRALANMDIGVTSCIEKQLHSITLPSGKSCMKTIGTLWGKLIEGNKASY